MTSMLYWIDRCAEIVVKAAKVVGEVNQTDGNKDTKMGDIQ
jgi:hypothetical protein